MVRTFFVWREHSLPGCIFSDEKYFFSFLFILFFSRILFILRFCLILLILFLDSINYDFHIKYKITNTNLSFIFYQIDYNCFYITLTFNFYWTGFLFIYKLHFYLLYCIFSFIRLLTYLFTIILIINKCTDK